MPNFSRALWRKAKASGGNGGGCVELAFDGEYAAVRDSKNVQAGHIVTDRAEFVQFLHEVKAGRLDLTGRTP